MLCFCSNYFFSQRCKIGGATRVPPPVAEQDRAAIGTGRPSLSPPPPPPPLFFPPGPRPPPRAQPCSLTRLPGAPGLLLPESLRRPSLHHQLSGASCSRSHRSVRVAQRPKVALVVRGGRGQAAGLQDRRGGGFGEGGKGFKV